MNRLEAAVKATGMAVFARIDHAAGADSVGSSLLPTELLIFGNANAGTPLMQSIRTIDPAWLAKRHGLDGTTEAAAAKMTLRK